MTHRAPRRRILCIAIAVLAGGALAGCFNPFDPLVSRDRGVSTPAPAPNSPENILRLLEWCWNNRALDEYKEVFTDDYRFVFAQTDSAGNAFRDRPFTREDELATATNLFVGGGTQPPATTIALTFDRSLYVQPDSRIGKNPRWHKQINTRVTLSVRAEDIAYDVQGQALYFVVRGDSAVIPQELIDRGFARDSTRWWIERWEDQTVQLLTAGDLARARSAGARTAATPARTIPALTSTLTTPVVLSWGALKGTFRQLR